MFLSSYGPLYMFFIFTYMMVQKLRVPERSITPLFNITLRYIPIVKYSFLECISFLRRPYLNVLLSLFDNYRDFIQWLYSITTEVLRLNSRTTKPTDRIRKNFPSEVTWNLYGGGKKNGINLK